MRDFRKLEVWKEGIDFCQAIYQLTSTLPKDEKYGLVSQMNRAGVSIPVSYTHLTLPTKA